MTRLSGAAWAEASLDRSTYAVLARSYGLVKIGSSNNPIRRLKSLQDGCVTLLRRLRGADARCSVPLELIGTTPSNIEAELHGLLSFAHVEKEWFRYDGFTKPILDEYLSPCSVIAYRNARIVGAKP